ncbi:MAG TPA: hypothetical protein VLS94_08375 [Fusibacter sp.]|nr:hypothetical protein [Fusibacter sp.]
MNMTEGGDKGFYRRLPMTEKKNKKKFREAVTFQPSCQTIFKNTSCTTLIESISFRNVPTESSLLLQHQPRSTQSAALWIEGVDTSTTKNSKIQGTTKQSMEKVFTQGVNCKAAIFTVTIQGPMQAIVKQKVEFFEYDPDVAATTTTSSTQAFVNHPEPAPNILRFNGKFFCNIINENEYLQGRSISTATTMNLVESFDIYGSKTLGRIFVRKKSDIIIEYDNLNNCSNRVTSK